MWRDKQDEKCANHRSRLDQIDAALAGRRPAVGCRRRRHTFGFTCGCDERRHLTVTVAAAADVDGAREVPERALPPRHRIPAYRRQLTEYSRIPSSGARIVGVAPRAAATRRRSNGS